MSDYQRRVVKKHRGKNVVVYEAVGDADLSSLFDGNTSGGSVGGSIGTAAGSLSTSSSGSSSGSSVGNVVGGILTGLFGAKPPSPAPVARPGMSTGAKLALAGAGILALVVIVRR